MAPPSSRRSGSSRRAQYGVFTGYLIASAGALIGVILLVLSLVRPEGNSTPGSVATSVVSPAGEGVAIVRDQGQGLIESIQAFWYAGQQNADLKDEVELARIRLEEAKAIQQENARLKSLLGLADGQVKPVLVTRLVGSSAVSSRRFGYLGAGRNDGIEVGMPVRSERGVIGRILQVGPTSSRVLFLTDTQSVVPVRLADPDREVVAFAEGRGDRLLRIRLIRLGLNPLKKGDVLVTSGVGGYYHPGTAVAIVSEVTDDGARARMISDPAATNYVSVEPIWQAELVDAANSSPDEPFDDGPSPKKTPEETGEATTPGDEETGSAEDGQ